MSNINLFTKKNIREPIKPFIKPSEKIEYIIVTNLIKLRENMNDFKLTLDYKEYSISSTSSSGNDRSWTVFFNHGGIRINIDIPYEKKMTRGK